jgi:hypothetical protein
MTVLFFNLFWWKTVVRTIIRRLLSVSGRSAEAEKRPGLSAIATGDGGTVVLLFYCEKNRFSGRRI